MASAVAQGINMGMSGTIYELDISHISCMIMGKSDETCIFRVTVPANGAIYVEIYGRGRISFRDIT
jgi:hypothetical protein